MQEQTEMDIHSLVAIVLDFLPYFFILYLIFFISPKEISFIWF